MHAPTSPFIYEPPPSSLIHELASSLNEPKGPAKENMPEQQTPPAKVDTIREKMDEQTPSPKQKEDEQTTSSASASKKAKNFLILDLISPFDPKKRKAAGTSLYLKGLRKQRTT